MPPFDLDTAVARWRRDFERRHVFHGRDLDELETHLHDHIDGLLMEGMPEAEAFRRAVLAVGTYGEAEDEYAKTYWEKVRARGVLQPAIHAQLDMLKNYITVAFRNIRRHPGYAALNIVGLAVGLAACVLVGLFITEERAFDRFHAEADRIYRVVTQVHPPDAETSFVPSNGIGVGRTLAAEYPAFEDVVTMRWSSLTFEHEGQFLREQTPLATANFFEVFSFPLLVGNPETALEAPFTMVLSTELAEKYFGEATAALGQTLMLEGNQLYTVTGVTEVPPTSHIQFGAVLSYATFEAEQPEFAQSDNWFTLQNVNYVLLRPGVDPAQTADKVRGLYDEKMGEWNGYRLSLHMEPLTEIYLHTAYGNQLNGPTSDVKYVYLLGLIGAFLLLIACINFTNLSTARSAERAREVGVRKAVGSNRAQLIGQFLAESVVVTAVALVVAAVLVTMALPLFNELTGKAFALADVFVPGVGLAAAGLVVLVGVLAGLYPAFVLARHQPALVLKGTFRNSRRGIRLRRGLVVAQFAISCVLIIATLVVVKQLGFMRTQDLGFDKERVLVINVSNTDRRAFYEQYESFRSQLAALPGVESVAGGYAMPGGDGWRGQVAFPEGPLQEEGIILEYIPVGMGYFEALGLEARHGRTFSPDFAERDFKTSVVINEAAARAVGWDPAEAVGKRFDSPGSGRPEGIVAGVVPDYHHHGLQEDVGPIMYGAASPWNYGQMALRLAPGDVTAAVDRVRAAWDTRFAGYPFDYSFLDDAFDAQYRTEQRLTQMFMLFAGLAIFVACLGLIGLAAFTAQQRRKEIGVRKVLGSSVSGIVTLLSREFAVLVLVGVALAVPVAWWLMRQWLDTFAYRTSLDWWVFVVAGVLALAVALLAVSWQAVRAATADPVKSLRYE